MRGATCSFHQPSPEIEKELGFCLNEHENIEFIVSRLEPGDVFWDVGAHLGVFTCFVEAYREKEGWTGQTVAFEPNGEAVRLLRRNLRKNGLSASIQEIALSDRSEEVKLPRERQHDFEGGLRLRRDCASEGPDDQLTAKRAEELIETGLLPEPDLMKIDVEGWEKKVLDGFGDLLNPRVLMVEVHQGVDSDTDGGASLLERLRNEGFSLLKSNTRKDETFLWLEKPGSSIDG